MHKIESAPCGGAKTCFECPYPDCTWTGRKTPEAFRAAKERQVLRERIRACRAILAGEGGKTGEAVRD